MNRNVTILIIVLIVLLMTGYLLWLRGRFQTITNQAVVTPTPQVVKVETVTTPTVSQVIGSPSATATSTGKISPTVTKTATAAGSKVK